MRKRVTTLLMLTVATTLCLAQDMQFPGRRRSRAIAEVSDSGLIVVRDRRGVPNWERNPLYPDDVFTFARVLYNPYGSGGRGKWATDWPDSDLNFSFRLQQLTSLEVSPDPVVLQLSDPRLFDFPFLYIIEPGGWNGAPGTGMNLSPEEVTALRRYCLNGGFVMVDDFWGEDEWAEFYREIKKVFPDREPVDLELDHDIFHFVYDLKEKPQVPAINVALSGRSYERWDAEEVHYRAFLDDRQRPMMVICHNTDLGDGWEREGENHQYFKEYSEPKAYPMGINILVYAMTH